MDCQASWSPTPHTQELTASDEIGGDYPEMRPGMLLPIAVASFWLPTVLHTEQAWKQLWEVWLQGDPCGTSGTWESCCSCVIWGVCLSADFSF